jgi:hypothetical protein
VSVRRSAEPSPYSNPYLVGVGLGLVLLAAFVVMGRGLGASGAFASSAAGATALVSPQRAQSSALFAGYLKADGGAWSEWLIFEIVGVAIGGVLSAWLAGRLRFEVERGPRFSRGSRLATAFLGGSVMGTRRGVGARMHERAGADGGRTAKRRKLAVHDRSVRAAYLVAPFVRRAWL